MKRYQCHKIVEAAKVRAAEKSTPRGPWTCACDDGDTYSINGVMRVTEEDLGYIVQYSDGYISWSPAKAFEEGYTLIDALASNSGGL